MSHLKQCDPLTVKQGREKKERKKKRRRHSVCGKRENLSDFSMTFSHCLSKGNYFIKQSEITQHSLQITCSKIIAINNIAIILYI